LTQVQCGTAPPTTAFYQRTESAKESRHRISLALLHVVIVLIVTPQSLSLLSSSLSTCRYYSSDGSDPAR
jgi:hypothetical protein